MALKRTTKSIPLSGGSNNEAPDELLSPPGMLHIENARFSKRDYAEKTEPMTSQGSTGLIFSIGQVPFALEEVNGDLIAIGTNEVSRYNGTDFTNTDHATTPLGLRRALNVAEQAGGTNYSWCRAGVWSGSTLSVINYIVTFEKRSSSGVSGSGSVDGYVQRYDVSGNLVDEGKLVGANGIRCHAANDGSVAASVIYQVGGTIYHNYVNYTTLSSAVFTASTTTVATTVQVGRQEMLGSGAWATLPTEELRLGFAHNVGDAATFVSKHHETTGNGVVAWKDAGAGGRIYFKLLTAAGLPTGSAILMAGISADVGITAVNCVLDVDINDTHVYMLSTLVNTTTGSSGVYIKSGNLVGGSALTSTVSGGFGGTVPNGTISVLSPDYQHVAFTLIGGNADARIGLPPAGVDGVKAYRIATRGAVPSSYYNLGNHRVASTMVSVGSHTMSLVVEQYGNFTPNDNGDNARAAAITPAALKPVTSVLVQIGNGTVEVLGTMDAGQSKVQDHGFSEQCNFLPPLDYQNVTTVNGELLYRHYTYLNRNITTLEDSYMWLSTDTAAANDEAMGNMVLNSGSSRANLYEISPLVPLTTVKYGEGFLINTAVPMWFDGAGLSEASIIDQPEITGVNDSDVRGSGALTWYAYGGIKAGYQTITCVCGYSDGAGKTHRSAPSFPLFVGGLHDPNTGDIVQEVTVEATPPLTVAGENREYFMEFYLADEGDSVGDLAATTFFQPGVSGQQILASFVTNTAPTSTITTINANATAHQSPPVYTAGDVLPADPWPSFKHMAATSRRLFALSESSPSTIYYSKIFEENVSPEFSAALVISVGGATKLTAIGRIDDKIMAFEKDAIHLIYGPGPDNTGANGDFFVERVSSKFGCEDVESLLETNDGLAYYSSISKEFHLISRDIEIIDIGKPVQDITANTSFDIHSSLVYPSEHELRWYVTNVGTTNLVPTATIPTGGKEQPPRARTGRDVAVSNPVLVYNTQYAKWSTNDGPAIGYATTLYNNKPALLDSSSAIWTTSADWTDGNLMIWETPWIKVNMLQDFGRIFKATFLGKYLSSWDDTSGSVEAGDLNITCSYDYEEDGDTDTHRFRANEHFGASQGERLQFSVRPDRPKCQAIKFRIEETATTAIEVSEPTYATGRGMSLLSVDIHYGVKGGSSRISAKRKL